MLRLRRDGWHAIMAEAWRAYPEEACGVLIADSADPDSIVRFEPIRNAAASSKIFTLDPMQHLKAERRAEDEGLAIVGVVHSHTHTSAYPSPTDVAEATSPMVPHDWHWAIVSLAWGEPELRSYRVNGKSTDFPTIAGMAEEQVALL